MPHPPRTLAYFNKKQCERLDSRARLAEWDFLARVRTEKEVLGLVGPGWRPLVRFMHGQLLIDDPDYRLVELKAKDGELKVYARFDPSVAPWCEVEVRRAQLFAVITCELCGQPGKPRRRRPVVRTLCKECFGNDRSLALEHGERYADIYLDYLFADEPEMPTPEAIEAWLQLLERSS